MTTEKQCQAMLEVGRLTWVTCDLPEGHKGNHSKIWAEEESIYLKIEEIGRHLK